MRGDRPHNYGSVTGEAHAGFRANSFTLLSGGEIFGVVIQSFLELS
jgi:hypothetical protein